MFFLIQYEMMYEKLSSVSDDQQLILYNNDTTNDAINSVMEAINVPEESTGSFVVGPPTAPESTYK